MSSIFAINKIVGLTNYIIIVKLIFLIMKLYKIYPDMLYCVTLYFLYYVFKLEKIIKN